MKELRSKRAVTAEKKPLLAELEKLRQVNKSEMEDVELKEHEELENALNAKIEVLDEELVQIQAALDAKKKGATEDVTFNIGEAEITYKDLPKVTVKPEEKGYVHVRLVRHKMDTVTGLPVNKPYVHICTKKEYNQFLNNKQGLKIIQVIHMPK